MIRDLLTRWTALVVPLATLGAQELLFVDAKVWTGDPTTPRAEAVFVQGDRILFVGDAAAAKALAGPKVEVIDCGGNSLLPGLTDAHVHFLWGGDEQLAPDLRSARSEEEFAQRLGEASVKVVKGSWLQSGSWDHENWPGGALPTRAMLDRFVPDHPVFVTRLDGHMAVANSLAIRIAGVTAKTPDPPGGTIVRDAHDEPAGVFKDAAVALVSARMPAWTQEQRHPRAIAAMQHAASLGITSVHDMLDSWAPLQTYQDLRAQGLLTCRITVYTPSADVGRWAAVHVRRGFGDAWLKVNGIK